MMMDNFQVNLTNIFILALWCVIIPCLSGLIYLLLSTSNKEPSIPRVNKVVAVPVLALITISLLMVVGKLTIEVQAINPLCVGVGDPNQMMCFGRGFVPMNDAIAINNSKLSSDLVRTMGIPIIVSVSLAIILTFAQRMRKARLQTFTQ
jgi:hypothetical protein